MVYKSPNYCADIFNTNPVKKQQPEAHFGVKKKKKKQPSSLNIVKVQVDSLKLKRMDRSMPWAGKHETPANRNNYNFIFCAWETSLWDPVAINVVLYISIWYTKSSNERWQLGDAKVSRCCNCRSIIFIWPTRMTEMQLLWAQFVFVQTQDYTNGFLEKF